MAKLDIEKHTIRKYLYENTDLSYAEIAKESGYSRSGINVWVGRHYSEEYRDKRTNEARSTIRRKENHPRYGKRGEDCLNFKHGLTKEGYRQVYRPDWFTGNSNQTRVLEHHIVYCSHNNITEIPIGYLVHHKDFDKLNNDPDNLELMTISEHSILHHALRRGT
jgi:hypothetical protein